MAGELDRFEQMCTGGKNSKLNIFSETINPGEQVSMALPLPELLGYTPLYMPIKIVHGKQAGPCMLMFATMRGNEFDGMEIIRKVLDRADMSQLQGTILAVPVLNVFGLLNRSKYLPNGQTLASAFPGKETGDYAARLAHLFIEQLFKRCDACIEFCSGLMNHSILPHVYTDLSLPVNRAMAEAFPVSVITDIEPDAGTIHEVAKQMDKPMLTYRAGEAMRFNEKAIRTGARGAAHLLRAMKMLPPDSHSRKSEQAKAMVCDSNSWSYATKSGLARHFKTLGDKVKAGETLSKISEPLGSYQEVTVKSEFEGVVVGMNTMPLVFEGDTLYRIAAFEQLDEAADKLQTWSQEHVDGTDITTATTDDSDELDDGEEDTTPTDTTDQTREDEKG